MALRDRVQLLPPVPDRHAVFWSNKAVETTDFEVTFTFSGYSQENSGRAEDGFLAFWCGGENFAGDYNEQAIVTKSKEWKDGMTSAGLTFLGNRPTFTGFAVVFLGQDATSSPRQSITGLSSDGSKALSLSSVLAEGTTKYVDWLTGGTQVKLRVSKDGSVLGSVMTLDLQKHFAGTIWGWAEDGMKVVEEMTFELDFSLKDKAGTTVIGKWEVLKGNRIKIEFSGKSLTMRVEGSHRAVQDSSSDGLPGRSVLYYGSKTDLSDHEEWTEVFRFPKGTFSVPAGRSFMGFSGWSGSKSWIEVDLHRVDMRNFDLQKLGEASSDVLEDENQEWLKVLESEKRYVSQADQKEAVTRLTKLLSEHVDKYDKLGEQIKEDLVKMDARLDSLSADLGTYYGALQSLNKETHQFDAEAVKEHIVGIRSVLTRDKESHDIKMHQVASAAKDLKVAHTKAGLGEEGKAKVQSVADQSRAVEEFAARGSMQTNGLLLVMVIAVAGLGLLFFNRMRYYEKKHYI
jgi:hypothetical protein